MLPEQPTDKSLKYGYGISAESVNERVGRKLIEYTEGISDACDFIPAKHLMELIEKWKVSDA